MEKYFEHSAEGTQDRRRLSVSNLLEVESLTGEPTEIMRLFEQWRDDCDLHGYAWIDVTPDNPFNFVLHNHPGKFVRNLSNRALNTYPYRMHARSCAAEYLECKTEAQPMAHYVEQELSGHLREYVRLMIPITNVVGRVTKIVYAFRYIKAPYS